MYRRLQRTEISDSHYATLKENCFIQLPEQKPFTILTQLDVAISKGDFFPMLWKFPIFWSSIRLIISAIASRYPFPSNLFPLSIMACRVGESKNTTTTPINLTILLINNLGKCRVS